MISIHGQSENKKIMILSCLVDDLLFYCADSNENYKLFLELIAL